MKKILSALIIVLTAIGCEPPVVNRAGVEKVDIKENMINANRTIAHSEETAIDEYIARRGWPMKKSSTGVRYWEYEVGKGAMIDYEDSIKIQYDVEALNGKTVYTSIDESFTVGRRQKMTGLDDAIRHLHRGSKAKVIIPSSLAYGIAGDGDRITQSMVLVIELKIEN